MLQDSVGNVEEMYMYSLIFGYETGTRKPLLVIEYNQKRLLKH